MSLSLFVYAVCIGKEPYCSVILQWEQKSSMDKHQRTDCHLSFAMVDNFNTWYCLQVNENKSQRTLSAYEVLKALGIANRIEYIICLLLYKVSVIETRRLSSELD